MKASTSRIYGPFKWHIGILGNFVQGGLGRHLMEGDTFELWSAHTADQTLHGQQCRLADVVDPLPLPSHTFIRTYVRIELKDGAPSDQQQYPDQRSSSGQHTARAAEQQGGTAGAQQGSQVHRRPHSRHGDGQQHRGDLGDEV